MNVKEYNKTVDELGQRLYTFIYNNLKDADDSKNLVQDSFESLWINRNKIDMNTVKGYLFTLAYRKMIDHIRKNQKMKNYLAEMKIEIDYGFENNYESKDLVSRGFEQLNEKYRNCILLRDLEGYSYEEISKITGLSSAVVRTNIFRGRKALQKIIRLLEQYKKQ